MRFRHCRAHLGNQDRQLRLCANQQRGVAEQVRRRRASRRRGRSDGKIGLIVRARPVRGFRRRRAAHRTRRVVRRSRSDRRRRAFALCACAVVRGDGRRMPQPQHRLQRHDALIESDRRHVRRPPRLASVRSAQRSQESFGAQGDAASGLAETGDHAEQEKSAQQHTRHRGLHSMRFRRLFPRRLTATSTPPPPRHAYAPASTCSPYQSPTSFTSGSSAMPLCSLTFVARHLDQRAHVIGARSAQVHDEVRVAIGKRRAADANALHPGALEQASGEVAGRILENRSRVGNSARLARRALGAHFRHLRAQQLAITTSQLEVDSRNDEVGRELGAPIGEFRPRLGSAPAPHPAP